MEIQTTEQPKCNKKQIGGAEPPSMLKKLGRAFVQAMKNGLFYLLAHPSAWRFLMVHVPDWAEKIWHFLKGIASFINDLF